MPFDLITGLSHGQREAIKLLDDDLNLRHDLSEHAKRDLIEDRLAAYHQRNDDRSEARLKRLPSSGVTFTPTRYFIGACLDCERELWTHQPRPRVPLCAGCKGRRVKRAREARRASEARRVA